MEKNSKIYVAGHNGMVGSAIVRKLKQEGFQNIILRRSSALDLRSQQEVFSFFENEKPDYVFMSAAKVGGIVANNTFRGEFLYDNLVIQNNVIHASYVHGVEKLLFLGSSCIYPKLAPQPLKEEYLLTGPLEQTNEPYAIAKIAGLKMVEAYRSQYNCKYISVMPTNLYGPNDNYDLQNSHVLPALLRKFHKAKAENKPTVEVWGSGKPRREFLHVDDLADALFFLMQEYEGTDWLNIGTGKDISIKELAELMKETTGYTGEIVWNTQKPDGTMVKRLDTSKINALGWFPKIDFREGVAATYNLVKQRGFGKELN